MTVENTKKRPNSISGIKQSNKKNKKIGLHFREALIKCIKHNLLH